MPSKLGRSLFCGLLKISDEVTGLSVTNHTGYGLYVLIRVFQEALCLAKAYIP